MTTSTSRLAFTDCLDIFDRALNARVGVRRMFDDYGPAAHFITRMHRFREIDRRDNAESYEKGHPLHGRSVYDQCVVRRPRVDSEGKWWVYIEKMDVSTMVIEEIEPEAYEEPKAIEDLREEAAE
jgi:hypothetical protein